MIPHITDEIKRRINRLAGDDVDVVITEIGGTVGDIEILPFLEAIRQFRLDIGRNNVAFVHVTLVPFIGPSGEQKTKPTQHSVTELRARGIQPDVIVCRSERPLSDSLKQKISRLCDVPTEAVVNAADASNLYEVPLVLHEEGFDGVICRHLGIDQSTPPDLSEWERLVERVESTTRDRAHRHHRQVREPARRLPVGGRGAQARRVPPRGQRRHRVDPGRGHRGAAGRGPAARPRRHRDPRRVRRAWGRRQDRGRQLRPREPHPLPGPLPRHAGHDHRVRPQRAGAHGRQLDRVRPVDPARR